MSRNTKCLAVVCLAAGALLGYAAASGTLSQNRSADAAPAALKVASNKADDSSPPPCYMAGGDRDPLLVRVDVQEAGQGQPPASGKKPNILFIMGDVRRRRQHGDYRPTPQGRQVRRPPVQEPPRRLSRRAIGD